MEFMPHGHCYYWEPTVLWSHVIGDGLTVLAYYAIPFLLVRFVKKRTDLQYKGIFLAFAAFIIFCGTVHLFALISTWYPFYRVEGALKLGTAAISLYTVYLLYSNFAKILAIPNPNDMVLLNQQLLAEIEEHKETQKLLSMKSELEVLVKQKTEQLEDINRELEAFSYSVSHDLRAPLRAISGYTSIVKTTQADQLDASSQKMLNHVVKSTNSMGALIDGLLDFSRLGKKGITLSIVNTNALVADLWNEHWLAASKPVIELTITNLPDTLADAEMLRQVWHNLISNAIKFSAKSPNQTIKIDGKIVDDFTQFSITDNGVGFNMDYKHKIFGVFQRLHHEDDFEGTGVGLSFVQRIVIKHHGKVWAESEIGKGSTFYFSIPINPIIETA